MGLRRVLTQPEQISVSTWYVRKTNYLPAAALANSGFTNLV
jgi:hypothetical protein